MRASSIFCDKKQYQYLDEHLAVFLDDFCFEEEVEAGARKFVEVLQEGLPGEGLDVGSRTAEHLLDLVRALHDLLQTLEGQQLGSGLVVQVAEVLEQEQQVADGLLLVGGDLADVLGLLEVL